MVQKQLAVPHLNVPPPDESATFQHAPNGPLQREWEPGCQPDEVYARVLSPWRDSMRRWLVRRLKAEGDWFPAWQASIRTPGRDTYFYWTAVFGTHTFFVALLPMFFFFNNPVNGRGLLYIVSLGVYVSSFAKDLVCTPRPYSPPVIRLSMSTHHNEYGFPSSHSTNAVSIALFFVQLLFQIRESLPASLFFLGLLLNSMYMISVVSGRLYTGMHSTGWFRAVHLLSRADVIGGIIMGLGCWLFWLVLGGISESWVNSGTNWVPIITVPLTLALVHFHPEPVDDCPCFEDAIAVLSCTMGSFVGHWQVSKEGLAHLLRDESTSFKQGMIISIIIGTYRILLGLSIMMVFRIIAKSILLRILPPIFRFANRGYDIELTTRRFYKAATDYDQIPHPSIRAVPSVLDLHPDSASSFSPNVTPTGSATPSFSSDRPASLRSLSPIDGLRRGSSDGLRARTSPLASAEVRTSQSTQSLLGEKVFSDEPEQFVWVPRRKRKSRAERAKYDAEVLTKVGVYAGLGYLATTPIPLLFRWLEMEVFPGWAL